MRSGNEMQIEVCEQSSVAMKNVEEIQGIRRSELKCFIVFCS